MLEVSEEKESCSFCETHFKGEDLYKAPYLSDDKSKAYIDIVASNIKYCPLCGNELKDPVK